ncbi:ATP-grasp ribosomal peptide maturase [Actinomadura sp. NBRC 104425]|uniref:ATP-grasp ribosomal peptide maturase n=1 Tax=Actinomadura sp. NBRC 104425 TaxID=3032204 RepID=UPI0024A28893|nr:ATP-grasp ribosomal peptide maturase [Actinomadura sp. NBRC 104425]GLZ15803.1 ATP-grasp ribosomal peptide maturase [Actinomadura sp. NBRC 104425]
MSEPRPVLVVTQPDDLTADLVIEQLNQRCVPIVRFDTADFPHALTLHARIDSTGLHGILATPSRNARLDAVRSLYYRRPRGFTFTGLDEQDARFATLQARYGLGGVLASLPGCLYVNHPRAIADAEFKPAQLTVAAEVGFTIPATLITNSPDNAREFTAQYAPIVYKPLRTAPYQRDGRSLTIWVEEVDPAELDEQIAGTAHLFQARVAAEAFLRVTAIGDRVFCVRIDSGDQLDWRYDYDALAYTAVDPPPGLADLVAAYLKRFGLVFGCFDFALRPDGGPVFLECNPNGQWRRLEDETGLPMTAALADLLERGTS